ncbi:MAG TPA: integrase arm-type DNA-binding domain-containing protein [Steroidobacteraceae bacterium]|nr:integrase arm-type DNA-binding domain-containing protein [Steroidobacteraceae bacterium]
MPLTDAEVLTAPIPAAGQRKFFDGRGLFLFAFASGSKGWRMRYRFAGKEKLLSLGTFPAVSLAQARVAAEAIRVQVAAGTDPSAQRQQVAAAVRTDAENTFLRTGEQLLERNASTHSPRTQSKNAWLLSLLRPLHAVPVSQVTAAQVLAAVQPLERAGQHESAHRAAALANRVLHFAANSGMIGTAPHIRLRDVLRPVVTSHHAGVTTPRDLGVLLRAIDVYSRASVRNALRLAPHVFVRPGELRAAEWVEFDLSRGLWTIPANRMKMRRPHVVPLSAQAVAILKDQQAISGTNRYVFPSGRAGGRPLSDGALGAALRLMDYPPEVHTPHGFRTTASTLLNERGVDAELIELQLAHKDPNAIRGAYNRAEKLPERAALMQRWSNYLDLLRAEAERVHVAKAVADFVDLGPLDANWQAAKPTPESAEDAREFMGADPTAPHSRE